MKKLKVPLRLQGKQSKDCGPVCVQMVLEYFGIKKDLKNLQEKLHYIESGTTAYDNGSLLLDEGLKVTAVTAQPMLFPPDIAKSIKDNKDIYEIIGKKAIHSPKYKTNLDTLKVFLEKGGKMLIQIPNIKHICAAIDEGHPIIALLYGGALGSKEGGFHFVVVTGYDAKNVFLNNPLPGSSSQSKFPIDQFLYAVHSSTTADIDNGTLLIVSK
jgi:hypothetical protein